MDAANKKNFSNPADRREGEQGQADHSREQYFIDNNPAIAAPTRCICSMSGPDEECPIHGQIPYLDAPLNQSEARNAALTDKAPEESGIMSGDEDWLHANFGSHSSYLQLVASLRAALTILPSTLSADRQETPRERTLLHESASARLDEAEWWFSRRNSCASEKFARIEQVRHAALAAAAPDTPSEGKR